MNKYEIIRRIEEFAPPELAESWDCSGWLIETDKQNVRKIMLCLTVTDDVVKQAKNRNCDMIISHHPLFYVPVTFSSPLAGEGVRRTGEGLIDIYCAHTNLDRTPGGTTDTIIETLYPQLFTHYSHSEAKNTGFFANAQNDVIAEESHISKIFTNSSEGFLRYIEFKENVSIHKFLKQLRTISPNLRYVNNYDVSEIKKIAFCAGSGAEFIKEACENGADALVTGDIKFHTALESPIVLFDIGHFESEILVLSIFEKLFDGVETVRANEYSPFKY